MTTKSDWKEEITWVGGFLVFICLVFLAGMALGYCAGPS